MVIIIFMMVTMILPNASTVCGWAESIHFIGSTPAATTMLHCTMHCIHAFNVYTIGTYICASSLSFSKIFSSFPFSVLLSFSDQIFPSRNIVLLFFLRSSSLSSPLLLANIFLLKISSFTFFSVFFLLSGPNFPSPSIFRLCSSSLQTKYFPPILFLGEGSSLAKSTCHFLVNLLVVIFVLSLYLFPVPPNHQVLQNNI